MAQFTPTGSLIGGLVIGVAVALLIVFDGRIAGIAGIMNRLFVTAGEERRWRIYFIGGLLAGGVAWRLFDPAVFGASTSVKEWPALAAGGLLVGIGTTLANGCTSGHGLCGISRMSLRSLVATGVFMAAGMLTVSVIRGRLG